MPSACFRLEALPFGPGEEGYEDWYLVDDWAALAELNEAAIDAVRRPSHDRAAGLAGPGWAGVYRQLRGRPAIPEQVRWLEKRRGEAVEEALAGLADAPAWQRQLVLGPAPELCVGGARGQPGSGLLTRASPITTRSPLKGTPSSRSRRFWRAPLASEPSARTTRHQGKSRSVVPNSTAPAKRGAPGETSP